MGLRKRTGSGGSLGAGLGSRLSSYSGMEKASTCVRASAVAPVEGVTGRTFGPSFVSSVTSASLRSSPSS